ncbi:SDR family oxidoreductase [Polynucleobacter paneuropaeus]|nr:SDR family oxidoreductase [Polynucleobacter paneuropaeus]
MELELSGRKALVTGSSRGIGRAIAEALQDEGCSVALNARNEAELNQTARELGCAAAVAGDVSSAEEAQRIVGEAVAALGGLDILVCNVGSGRSVPPGNETYEEWQRVFALNLWSTTNVIEAARSELEDACGAVVCISSLCGLEVVPGAPVTYSAAKAALHAYVRGIARPLGKEGVRINAIAAGNILFKGSVWARKLEEDAEGVQLMLEREVALARLGTPQDVAGLAVYLASPRSGFATGAIWRLDGGQVHT